MQSTLPGFVKHKEKGDRTDMFFKNTKLQRKERKNEKNPLNYKYSLPNNSWLSFKTQLLCEHFLVLFKGN